MRLFWFAAVIAMAQRAPLFAPLVSPDGGRVLVGSDTAPQLWLEDTRTHQRRMVFRVTLQTLSAGWSPDSAAFFANDRVVSDVENAYIYDANTLARVDLGSRILAADPEAVRLKSAGNHAYFHAVRWLDTGHVEVQLFGHTDGVPTANGVKSGECFDLRYRAAKNGTVERRSRRVASLDSKSCGAIESEAR